MDNIGTSAESFEEKMAVRRSNALRDLLANIEDEVSWPTWKALEKILDELRTDTITFDQFCVGTTIILKNHTSRCRELQDLMHPGTDAYLFGPAFGVLRFRWCFDREDLALPWNAKGDKFSTLCALCRDNFTLPVRTLRCKHTFCVPCLTTMLWHKGVDYESLRKSPTCIVCPTCRTETTLASPTPDTLDEKAYNSVLEAFYTATRRYMCPFEGCDESFEDSYWHDHVMRCCKRKSICQHGCGEPLTMYTEHLRPEQCIRFIKTQRDQERKEKAAFKAQVQKLKRPRLLDKCSF